MNHKLFIFTSNLLSSKPDLFEQTMNGLQTSTMTMYRGVQLFVREHSEQLLKLPGFDVVSKQFDENVAKLWQLYGVQMEAGVGSAITKKLSRKTMTEVTLDVSRRMVAMAVTEEDLVLKYEAKCTKRQMTLSTSYGVMVNANRVLDLAVENKERLQGYGVDDALLAELKEAIADYRLVISKPRLGIAERHTATEGITEVMKENVALLQKMDVLMAIVQTKNDVLYVSYQGWRKITNTGLRHLALKGMVKDAATNQGLKGVVIEFELIELDGKDVAPDVARKARLVKSSGVSGGFLSRRMVEGEYEVTASKNGYVTQRLIVYKADGETCKVEIGMVGIG